MEATPTALDNLINLNVPDKKEQEEKEREEKQCMECHQILSSTQALREHITRRILNLLRKSCGSLVCSATTE